MLFGNGSASIKSSGKASKKSFASENAKGVVKRFLFSSSEAENGVEEKKKACRSPTAQSPAPTSEAESQDQKRIISLRSKSSFDGVSLVSEKNDCKTESKNDSKIERKKSSSSSQDKANMHFHKLFLDVPTEEPLRQMILFQISIPAFSVTLIKKTKTALLVPNALIIATVTDRAVSVNNCYFVFQYIFVSLLSRDSTYKLLKSVCGHLENTSIGNSPNPSPLENSFRADRPSSLPLVNFHVTESQTVLNVSKGEAKPTRADALVNRVPEGKAKSLPAHAGQPETIGIVHRVKSQKCPTLHHILIFYAVVVCALIISTFYMRYRINTLEERLGSLTSIVDTHQTEQTAPSGLGSQVQLNVEVLCQELTANIMRLEKVTAFFPVLGTVAVVPVRGRRPSDGLCQNQLPIVTECIWVTPGVA
ncbi:GRAM domain-containing protein 2B [Camelus dromedarius]|uniref:GRAM domain-containing protein 2B n=1 Tax=Camelus dromedarius TaxID=9838 RepID=A0A5N4EBG9_CAMDR|nr:GRAM domain-containing protein 2B [Camelus dromedarius]